MSVLRLPICAPLGTVKIQKGVSCAFAKQDSWPMKKEQNALVTTALLY